MAAKPTSISPTAQLDFPAPEGTPEVGVGFDVTEDNPVVDSRCDRVPAEPDAAAEIVVVGAAVVLLAGSYTRSTTTPCDGTEVL